MGKDKLEIVMGFDFKGVFVVCILLAGLAGWALIELALYLLSFVHIIVG